MDGVERYSKWIKSYEDWVKMRTPSPTPKKRREKERPKKEGSPLGLEPTRDRCVYESPFYKEYQRYIEATKGRSPNVVELKGVKPSGALREEIFPTQKVTKEHNEFWRAYDAIAREVIRREAHGGFIHKPSKEVGLVLKEGEDLEAIRSKIDSMVSDWSYWGLGMEEGVEVTRKSKDILARYLYDRLRGEDLSIYSEYGDDLMGYWPLIEVSPHEEKEEVSPQEEKREEAVEEIGRRREVAKEYAFSAYGGLKDLFHRMPAPIYTTEYVA